MLVVGDLRNLQHCQMMKLVDIYSEWDKFRSGFLKYRFESCSDSYKGGDCY